MILYQGREHTQHPWPGLDPDRRGAAKAGVALVGDAEVPVWSVPAKDGPLLAMEQEFQTPFVQVRYFWLRPVNTEIQRRSPLE